MGYETQLIIGDATGNTYGGVRYFMTYATIDMCKLGQHSALYDLDWCNKKDSDDPVYGFYAPAGDGDTQITEDRYGDVPKPIPIAKVIKALKKDFMRDDYRRIKWAIAMLEAIEASSTHVTVLLWGY